MHIGMYIIGIMYDSFRILLEFSTHRLQLDPAVLSLQSLQCPVSLSHSSARPLQRH